MRQPTARNGSKSGIGEIASDSIRSVVMLTKRERNQLFEVLVANGVAARSCELLDPSDYLALGLRGPAQQVTIQHQGSESHFSIWRKDEEEGYHVQSDVGEVDWSIEDSVSWETAIDLLATWAQEVAQAPEIPVYGGPRGVKALRQGISQIAALLLVTALLSLRKRFSGLRLAFLAGLAVMAVGTTCLYLSDQVAATGSWWQGTLDAFGVGFIVGGLIDVLAITGLSQALTRSRIRREAHDQYVHILYSIEEPQRKADTAREFLDRSGKLIDPNARFNLGLVIEEQKTRDKPQTVYSNADFAKYRHVPQAPRFQDQRLVFLAGSAVMAVGIICLYLSDQVAATGSWWQGTLDAFGVGFIVGGLIDVLAITGLNRVVTRDQRRSEALRQAEEILTSPKDPQWRADAARDLLQRSNDLHFEERVYLGLVMEEAKIAQHEDETQDVPSAQLPAETPDHGDTPQAPGNH